jgi:hypothetical protein
MAFKSMRALGLASSALRVAFESSGTKRTADQRDTTEERRAKLASLGRKSYVSQSGIASLLTSIKEAGAPDAFSRGSQYRARKSVCSTDTPFGKLVTKVDLARKDGKPCTIGMQHPLAMLHHQVKYSLEFSLIVRNALRERPNSPANPWGLIIYQDGVNPSDGLSKNCSRKSCVFYWSIVEFGIRALSHEECWFTPIVVRQDLVKCLDGGYEQLAELVLNQFFGAHGHDIMRAGVWLDLPDGQLVHIFARVAVMLADEPALKEMLGCKGHAGTKPCVLCQNITLEKAPGGGVPLHVHSEYVKSIANFDIREFKLHTDKTVRAMVSKLHRYKGVLPPDEFALREQLFGFNWNLRSIILNEQLNFNVVTCVMFDWSHLYLCDGLADTEFGMFMHEMKAIKADTTFRELGIYVATWTLPKTAPAVNRLFLDSSIVKNIRKGSFSSTASEFLSLVPILTRFMDAVVIPREELPAHVASFRAVLTVIETLQAVKRGIVSHGQLAEVITDHLRKFLVAYGKDEVRPKHHYAMHLPTILERNGMLFSTLVHERKHRMVKRYAKNRVNQTSWEQGTIEDITIHQMMDAQEYFLSTRVSSKPNRPTMRLLLDLFPNCAEEAFTLHSEISIENGLARSGDVVLLALGGELALAELLYTVGITTNDVLQLHPIVAKYRPLSGSGSIVTQTVQYDAAQVHIENIKCVLTCRHSACRTTCSAYIPLEYRR